MKFTAQQIADFLDGIVEGNQQEEVDNFSKIEEGKPGTLTFLANPKYQHYLYDTKASVVLIDKSFELTDKISATLVRVDDTYKAFAKLLELYQEQMNGQGKTGVEDNTFISDTAVLGQDIFVGAFSYIGENVKVGKNVRIYPQVFVGDNVEIGDNTVLYSGVKIYHHCVIGSDCRLHAGVVIGADGFGFAPQDNKAFEKVPQIGNVSIEDGVEIGANTTIDRATIGSTIIRKNVKLDNQIQIAHNVEIGENTVIAAKVGVSGSTKIGKNCMIAGQVGFAGHLKIGEHVIIGAQAGITNNVEDNQIIQGSPAFNIKDFQRSNVVFKHLPELRREVTALQRQVADLTKILENEE
ncbi:MAG: UDP-3-O-(3-hydroxymyristoyl)glucosamine N-acyltransferase [Candidatus Zixiibacteriota bacterium]|nr:MAG: UDP-3-O-(3-hydroxymyristoyl)glucosamine N-acyltransferase [candidate division Zixibacteria bacterium]